MDMQTPFFQKLTCSFQALRGNNVPPFVIKNELRKKTKQKKTKNKNEINLTLSVFETFLQVLSSVFLT